MACTLFTRILIFSVIQKPGLFSQEDVIIPPTPACVALQTPITFQCKPLVHIKYTSLPMIIAVEENNELNVTVNLIAYPPPITKWIFDKDIKTTDIAKGNEHSSTLFIANVSSEDLGDYTVYSSNDFGNLFIHLKLTIKGIPNPPYDVVVVCNSRSLIVLWKPGFNGGDQQTFYIMYWSDDSDKSTSNPIQDPDDYNTLYYVIKSMLQNTSYKLQVLTSNAYGKSESQILECTTDIRDQLTQQEGRDVLNMVGIVVLGIGVLLVVSAICHCAWHCRKQRNENTKKNKSAMYTKPTADFAKHASYATPQHHPDEYRCYDSLRNTSGNVPGHTLRRIDIIGVCLNSTWTCCISFTTDSH